MVSVERLFEMLSWNSPEEVQREGIAEAKNVQYLSIFFQPLEDKSVWENCANVISDKSDTELLPYLANMLEWLQDGNWPGYDTIFARLAQMPQDALAPMLASCADMAEHTQDEAWLASLAQLQAHMRK